MSIDNERVVAVGLLGMDAKVYGTLAVLYTDDEVRRWLSSHEDMQLDADEWRCVVVSVRGRGSKPVATHIIRITDWNAGERWDEK